MIDDLNKLVPWFQSLNLAINFDKTKFIIFKSINWNIRDSFNIIEFGNNKISSVSEYNYLGLIIDENLNWKCHIAYICSKISRYTFVLAKIRHVMNFKMSKTFYFAFIHSHISYLLPIWGNAPQTYLTCIQVLQNKLIKIMKFLPIDTHTESLYSTDFLSIQ